MKNIRLRRCLINWILLVDCPAEIWQILRYDYLITWLTHAHGTNHSLRKLWSFLRSSLLLVSTPLRMRVGGLNWMWPNCSAGFGRPHFPLLKCPILARWQAAYFSLLNCGVSGFLCCPPDLYLSSITEPECYFAGCVKAKSRFSLIGWLSVYLSSKICLPRLLAW